MLTEAQNFIIKDEEAKYALWIPRMCICTEKKSMTRLMLFAKVMMIKGNNPENIRVGSTLSTDEFAELLLILCCPIPLRETGQRSKNTSRTEKT
jgi:type I restriction-modification system DNA methylase subunit